METSRREKFIYTSNKKDDLFTDPSQRHLKTEDLLSKTRNRLLNTNSEFSSRKNKATLVIFSLIDDFLRSNSLKYTQSVFLPESGYSMSVMPRAEIANYFNIPIHSAASSILESLIVDGFITTKPFSEKVLEKDEIFKLKLKEVEDHYNEELASTKSKLYLLSDERLVEYKKEVDINMNKEINNEIHKFREMEIPQIRLEESLKFRKEMVELQERFDKEKDEYMEKIKAEKEEIISEYSRKLQQAEIISAEIREKSSLAIKEIKLREDKIKAQSQKDTEQINERMRKIDIREKEIIEKMNEINEFKIKEQKRLENEYEEFKISNKKEFDKELQKINEAKIEIESSLKIGKQVTYNNFLSQRTSLIKTNEELMIQNKELKEKLAKLSEQIESLDLTIQNISSEYNQKIDEFHREEQRLKKEVSLNANTLMKLEESNTQNEELSRKLNDLEAESKTKYTSMIEDVNNLKSSISALHSKYNEIITRMQQAHTIELEQNNKLFSLTIQEKEESMKQILSNLSSSKQNEHMAGNFIGTKLLIESSRNSQNLVSNSSIFLEEFRIKQEKLKQESANIKSEINQILCNLSHFHLINENLQGSENLKYFNIYENDYPKGINNEKTNSFVNENKNKRNEEDSRLSNNNDKTKQKQSKGSINKNLKNKDKSEDEEDQ